LNNLKMEMAATQCGGHFCFIHANPRQAELPESFC
jgi:hypothetical protein